MIGRLPQYGTLVDACENDEQSCWGQKMKPKCISITNAIVSYDVKS